MCWIDEVQARQKRNNQILFAPNDVFLQDLSLLIQQQNHRTLVLWAFEFADETVQKLRPCYPRERRLCEAVEISKAWAAGKVKMPLAKRAILNAHAVAKEIVSLRDIALCHAIGQACSVVHTRGHALGFPIYDLTALVRHHGVNECVKPVEARKNQYIERLCYWQQNHANHPAEWADFMPAD